MSAEVDGSTITGPTLIFHDEIVRSFTSMMICRTPGALWHFPNGNSVDQIVAKVDLNQDFQQLILRDTSRLIRIKDASELTNISLSGLWSCRLNGSESGATPIGIYSRGGGE